MFWFRSGPLSGGRFSFGRTGSSCRRDACFYDRAMDTQTSVAKLSAPDVEARLSRGEATLLDVREPGEFARERIDGATLHPIAKLDLEAIADLPGPVIVSCLSGGRASRAALLITEFRDDVYLLEGGLEGWKKAGLPTTINSKAPIPIMRQVQITAGSLVAVGTALGVLVSPWWLALPGFVGCGLVFAGVSGWCGMANLLGLMPWNRVDRDA